MGGIREVEEMNTHSIRRTVISVAAMLLATVLFASAAFPWGSATHAYIDNRIGRAALFVNLNEIYGGMASDLFNLYPDVGVPGTTHYNLYLQTHYNSLALWSEAQSADVTRFGKAASFGLVSHANGQSGGSYFGADYTAHGPGGNDAGYYVIDKAKLLWAKLKPLLSIAGIVLDDGTGEAVSHSIVETAIDIMVTHRMSAGSGIGKRMVESAVLRTPELPRLLVRAYGGSPEIEATIISAERNFRRAIIIYGQALAIRDEIQSVNAVAGHLADLADEMYGIKVSSTLIALAIMKGEQLCADDYRKAITDTVKEVKNQMRLAGIHY